MSDYLTRKIISQTKTETGTKKYTVANLRSEVRKLIKEANKILYDLDESKKASYMKQIASDIQEGQIRSSKTGDAFVQMNVKYMRSSQLQTAYNALTAFINADKESVEYAKRLAGREERMRKKTEKTLGKRISKAAYKKMMQMWEEYSDEVDMFGYSELIDYAKKTSRRKESIHDALQRGQQKLESLGITATPKQVLKYLINEQVIDDKIKELRYQGVEESKLYKEALEELSRQ